MLNISQHNKFCGVVYRKYDQWKTKIVCSVAVSRLEFVPVPIADQLQPSFNKLLCVEQRITKPDLKSTMYSVVKCP